MLSVARETPLCECGCGAPVTVYYGKPRRFIQNHHWRMPRKTERWRVDPATGCWEWLLNKHPNGYADGRAHRAIYEEHVGPIPAGLELDHLCRNRGCVNPAHLEPVTHAENLRRGAGTKLSEEDVAAIRSSSETHVALGRQYGVSASHIGKIRKGQQRA